MPRSVTYVPQMVTLAIHMCNFVTKHRAALNLILTDPLEQAAMNALVAACAVFQANQKRYLP
jgi:hypothetical protein